MTTITVHINHTAEAAFLQALLERLHVPYDVREDAEVLPPLSGTEVQEPQAAWQQLPSLNLEQLKADQGYSPEKARELVGWLGEEIDPEVYINQL